MGDGGWSVGESAVAFRVKLDAGGQGSLIGGWLVIRQYHQYGSASEDDGCAAELESGKGHGD